jgi:DNA-binding transcriptional regulator YiaG
MIRAGEKAPAEMVFTAFGFPVVVRGAPMMKFRGEWILDVDMNEFSRAILEAMPLKPARLTGAEIKFIRLELKMTQKDLVDQMGITHSAVNQWEKLGNRPTPMKPMHEIAIRLKVARASSSPKLKKFVEIYDKLVELLKTLGNKRVQRSIVSDSGMPPAWMLDQNRHVHFLSVP